MKSLADPFNELIRKYLPKHLYGQVRQFIENYPTSFSDSVAKKCIEKGILYVPEKTPCAEGTFMIVKESDSADRKPAV